MTIELWIEILLACLLAATCGYCFVLNKRLRVLRSGHNDLLKIIADFDSASKRAEKNISLMNMSGQNANKNLSEVTSRATTLMDELSVMVSAGDHVATRIETVVNEVRSISAKDKTGAAA